mgnify:FL=1
MATKTPAMSPSDIPVEEVLIPLTPTRRAEAEQLLALCREVSGEEPVVWARRIIGFGEYHYRYASGHSDNAPLLGFNSNNTKHTIYLTENFALDYPELMMQLGPHTASKACLYLNRLAGVDLSVLRRLLELSQAEARAQHVED